MSQRERQQRTVATQEQVIDDTRASGLTLAFWRTPGGEGRIRITGDLPFGNRDFQFNESGELVGSGTGVAGACPVNLRVVG
jgi:hypothetical protein